VRHDSGRTPSTRAAPAPAAEEPPAHGERSARRIDSRDLLGPAQEIEIDHGGLIYRLRRTSLGKLILTK
jgi:hemin uptake protein HemP